MRVLFTSKSSSGAWKIRGCQVASTCSRWIASNEPTTSEIVDSDIVCVVKKTNRALIEKCRELNKIIVLDIVDFWPQPHSETTFLDSAESKQVVIDEINKIQPDGLIFPNRAMWIDFHKFFPAIPSTYIYHHFRPEFDDILERISQPQLIIAYEGGNYLGEWHDVFQQIAVQQGASFVVNPDTLLNADVIVSARSTKFQTYLNCNYKSNVKAANAI
ncbi:hypothetical protein EBT25_17080, partial [bacterium]|nr:hypothetical protein [bacterium]